MASTGDWMTLSQVRDLSGASIPTLQARAAAEVERRNPHYRKLPLGGTNFIYLVSPDEADRWAWRYGRGPLCEVETREPAAASA